MARFANARLRPLTQPSPLSTGGEGEESAQVLTALEGQAVLA